MKIDEIKNDGLTVICGVNVEDALLHKIYQKTFKDKTEVMFITLSRIHKTISEIVPRFNDIITNFINGNSSSFFNTLLIDLPETLLTPENQVDIANKLVKIVNKGINVIITTNSEYMVKQFNILTMLSNMDKKTHDRNRIVVRFQFSEEIFLPSNKYHVYEYTKIDGQIELSKNAVTYIGAEIKTFNKVAESQNISTNFVM